MCNRIEQEMKDRWGGAFIFIFCLSKPQCPQRDSRVLPVFLFPLFFHIFVQITRYMKMLDTAC